MSPDNVLQLLQPFHADSALALWAGTHFQLHNLSITQGLEAVALDRCVVNENILTGLKRYEPEALAIAEPLDCTFLHLQQLLSCRAGSKNGREFE